MKCQTCSKDNPADAQFCGICGASLSASEASGIVGTSSELPMVSFINAIKLGFSNYFRFSGRSTRAEHWWWILFITLASMIMGIADTGINEFAAYGQSSVLSDLFGLATLIPTLALGARRLHDIGKSGWWQLGIILLAIVGLGLFVTGVVVAIVGFLGGFELSLILILTGLSVLLVSMGWWIWWFARKGDYGPNTYGPDPRRPTS